MRLRVMRRAAAACLAAVLAAPAWAAPAVHTVTIDGMRFVPEVLEVKAGDRVIWRNKDPFPHNARGASGAPASPDIASGASWTYTPARRGRFPYLCTLHSTMRGTLVVK